MSIYTVVASHCVTDCDERKLDSLKDMDKKKKD